MSDFILFYPYKTAKSHKIYIEAFNSAGNGSAAEMLLTGYHGNNVPLLGLYADNTIINGDVDIRAKVIRLGLQKNGGGQLAIGNNPNDNKIYLEALNTAGNGSAAEMLLTGQYGGNVPSLKLNADNTIINGNVDIQASLIKLGLEKSGGGQLVICNNKGDDSIYLEAFNSAGNDSAAEMLLTGKDGSKVPSLKLNAYNTVINGDITAKGEITFVTGDNSSFCIDQDFDSLRISLIIPVSIGVPIELSSTAHEITSNTISDKSSALNPIFNDPHWYEDKATIMEINPEHKVTIKDDHSADIFVIDAKNNSLVLRNDAGKDCVWIHSDPSNGGSGINLRDQNGNDTIVLDGDNGRLGILGGNWDPSNTEGDLKIGDETYRVKIGVARGGAGAGDVRIRADGGTNRLMLGGGKNDTLTITPDKVGIGTITPAVSLDVPKGAKFGAIHIGAKPLGGEPSVAYETIQLPDWANLRINFGSNQTATFWHDGKLSVGGEIEAHDVKLIGADCAEDFDITCTDPVEPGTVMVIDKNGALRPSFQAFDKRVAGVISGAGDLRPGITLDRQNERANRLPIALTGKVYCKVEADYEPVDVGDLLTTSATPGHAMKANDPIKSFGAVIGKALKSLETGRGLIPILVALQ